MSESPHGVMIDVLDCNIEVNKFALQSYCNKSPWRVKLADVIDRHICLLIKSTKWALEYHLDLQMWLNIEDVLIDTSGRGENQHRGYQKTCR